MKKGYFITATDTNAGKTFFAEALVRALRKRGIKTGVMKPVETGCVKENGELMPLDAIRLKNAAGSNDPLDLINPYRFALPLAPSIAARLARVEIDLKKIKDSFNSIKEKNDTVIVEGCGGLATPLSDDLKISDLALALELPLIIIVPSRLGCINSAVLACAFAAQSGLKTAAIILNRVNDKKDASLEFNFSELKRLKLPVKAELPFFVEGIMPKQGEFCLDDFVMKMFF